MPLVVRGPGVAPSRSRPSSSLDCCKPGTRVAAPAGAFGNEAFPATEEGSKVAEEAESEGISRACGRGRRRTRPGRLRVCGPRWSAGRRRRCDPGPRVRQPLRAGLDPGGRGRAVGLHGSVFERNGQP